MALVIGLGLFLVLYGNVVAVLRLRPGVRVILNVSVGALLVLVGRVAGPTLEEMGLSAEHLWAGLGWGVAASALMAIALGAGALLPAGARLLRDVRFRGMRGRALAFRVLVQIPLAIALFEELAFRGVLLGSLTEITSEPGAVTISSAIFGVWHVGPAMDRLRANRPDAGLREALTTVAGTVAVTSIGGALFALLRLYSGSVAAPILAHATANIVATLGAVRAWRQETPASRSISARPSGPG